MNIAEAKNLIRGDVERLLEVAEVKRPPVPLEKIAKVRGIDRIIQSDLGSLDGCLIPTWEKSVIRVNKSQSLARQNFTIAHEIGHTFFHRHKQEVSLRTDSLSAETDIPRNTEESLCNIIAAELLMPTKFFQTEMEHHPLSLLSISSLSRRFETSMQATALRLVAMATRPCILIHWQESDRTGSSSWKLRAKWSSHSKSANDFRPFVPRHAPPRKASLPGRLRNVPGLRVQQMWVNMDNCLAARLGEPP